MSTFGVRVALCLRVWPEHGLQILLHVLPRTGAGPAAKTGATRIASYVCLSTTNSDSFPSKRPDTFGKKRAVPAVVRKFGRVGRRAVRSP